MRPFQISDVNPNETVKQCSCGVQYTTVDNDHYCPVCYPGVDIGEDDIFGAGVLDGAVISDLQQCVTNIQAMKMLVTGYSMLLSHDHQYRIDAMKWERRLALEEGFLVKIRALAESRGLTNEYTK